MEAATTPAMPMPPPTHESVGGVGKALWKRKFWILIPTLLAFVGSLVIVNVLPTRYSGEARVLLENRETVYSRPERDNRVTDPAIDPEAVASQVQVVMSKDLALKVIRDLDLAKRAEFDPLAKGIGVLKGVLMALGLAPDPRTIPLEERVLETYYKRLLVFPQGKSRVISIEFQSEDAALAAAVANKIAEEYLKREVGAKNETSKTTSEWLDKAIEPLMKKVVAAEAKVEAFRASKGLFIGSNNMTITSQQLAELNSQLSTARAQQADLQSRAKLIREALRLGRVFETSEVNNNELVRRLLEQRAALKAQIAFDERTLMPGHPRMKELQSQLRDLEGQVRAAAERAARAFENDARAAGARVEGLQTELNSQKKSAKLSNEDEVQLKALERDAAALREQLNSYRNKFLDAAARNSDATSPADARIISRAFAQNDPVFPKKLPIVFLATLGTMIICMALVASASLMAQQAVSADAMGYAYGYPQAPQPFFPPADEQATIPPQPAQTPHQPINWNPAPPSPKPQAKEGLSWLFSFGKRKNKAANTFSPPPFAQQGYAPHHATVPEQPFPPLDQQSGYWSPPQPQVPISGGADPSPFIMPARPGAIADAVKNRPGIQAAEEIARELAMLGYLGRGKVLIVHGVEADARTSLYAMRFGRRLSRDGATIVIDLLGQRDLYTRVLGANAHGLSDYLRGVSGLGDIIHRDQRSKLHVIPAGDGLVQHLFGARTRNALLDLIEVLAQTYAHIVIDAGPAGSAGEMIADLADAFALMTPSPEEDHFLRATADRLEAVRSAPVFVILDEATPEPRPANDPNGPRQFGVG